MHHDASACVRVLLQYTAQPPVAACEWGGHTLWLKHGDEVVCEIDRIGRICNVVQAIPAKL